MFTCRVTEYAWRSLISTAVSLRSYELTRKKWQLLESFGISWNSLPREIRVSVLFSNFVVSSGSAMQLFACRHPI